MRSLLTSVICLACAASAARSQSPLEADAVAYRYDSTKAEVEVYYGVLQRALSFKETSSNAWESTIKAKAELWQGGSVVARQDITKPVRFQVSKASLDSMGANKLLGGAVFTAPYSTRDTVAFLWQSTGKEGKSQTDTLLIPVTLPDKDPAHFALGNLEIASSMDKSTGNSSPFEKAGYVVTPNPSAVFGENYTKLFYYTELYVPKQAIDPGQSVEIVSRIVDGTGREILSASQKQPLLGATIPVMTGLDIDGLAGDSYKLQVIAKQEGAVVAQVERPFYYVSDIKMSEEQPSPAAISDDALFALSDFSKLTDAEADERIAQTLYVAPEADRKTAKTLKSVSDKQHFLFGYWRKQDAQNPGKPALSAYEAFMDRVRYVNSKLAYQKTPGWKTSRGRVYIAYGPPFATHEELFNSQYRPYIVWDYEPSQSLQLTNGSRPEFDFVDRQGGGNYTLVNSNVRGETNEPNWLTQEAYRLSR